jgi:MFS family permease
MTDPTDHPVDESAVADEKVVAEDPEGSADASDDEIYPGDHGDWRAILCSVGVFLALFVGFGILNIPGTFVTYWETNQLVGYTVSQISWIAAVQFSLTLLGSVLTGRWFDMHGGRVRIPPKRTLFDVDVDCRCFCSLDRYCLFGGFSC